MNKVVKKEIKYSGVKLVMRTVIIATYVMKLLINQNVIIVQNIILINVMDVQKNSLIK